MAARAGVLGDVRTNHPRRWRLPERNWPPAANPSMQKVELAAVHAVVQLRIHKPGNSVYALSDSEHPLYPVVTNLLSDLPGVDLLSVEPMIRHLNDESKAARAFRLCRRRGPTGGRPRQGASALWPQRRAVGRTAAGLCQRGGPCACGRQCGRSPPAAAPRRGSVSRPPAERLRPVPARPSPRPSPPPRASLPVPLPTR